MWPFRKKTPTPPAEPAADVYIPLDVEEDTDPEIAVPFRLDGVLDALDRRAVAGVSPAVAGVSPAVSVVSPAVAGVEFRGPVAPFLPPPPPGRAPPAPPSPPPATLDGPVPTPYRDESTARITLPGGAAARTRTGAATNVVADLPALMEECGKLAEDAERRALGACMDAMFENGIHMAKAVAISQRALELIAERKKAAAAKVMRGEGSVIGPLPGAPRETRLGFGTARAPDPAAPRRR